MATTRPVPLEEDTIAPNARRPLLRLAPALLLFLAGVEGCETDGRASATGAAPRSVTYAEGIAPLLRERCGRCHHPEGIGPFSLLTYEDVVAHAGAVAAATAARRMPPWPADPGYSRFAGERLLTEEEIDRIGRWVTAGAPPGDTSALPPPAPVSDSSMLGTPDLVIPMAEAFPLMGDGRDHFLIVKVPFSLSQDTFARAIEFVPGRRDAVHHMNGHLLSYPPGAKRTVFSGRTYLEDASAHPERLTELDLVNDDGSYPPLQLSVVNYLPGAYPTVYPEGIGGVRLPRQGAFLINEMHYGPTTVPGPDRSYFNVFFDSAPPRRPVYELLLGTTGVSPVVPPLVIPPGESLRVSTRYRVPADLSILTVNPHMHLLGQSFLGYAVTPSGDTIPLIRIPQWDFRWQYFYTFRRPVKIPTGSELVAEGVYDNTAANPHNPFSPPREIRDRNGSMRTTDEMFQFIISYLPYRPGDEGIRLDSVAVGRKPREGPSADERRNTERDRP